PLVLRLPMILYHLCRSSEVAALLASGLQRAGGRNYLFSRWEDTALLLSGLYRQDDGVADPHVAVGVEADEAMVTGAPLPESRLPPSLRPSDLEQLQAHSYYAEVDISPHRISDVKNGFGDSILNHLQSPTPVRTPIRRFLAYARPYWPFVAGA